MHSCGLVFWCQVKRKPRQPSMSWTFVSSGNQPNGPPSYPISQARVQRKPLEPRRGVNSRTKETVADSNNPGSSYGEAHGMRFQPSIREGSSAFTHGPRILRVEAERIRWCWTRAVGPRPLVACDGERLQPPRGTRNWGFLLKVTGRCWAISVGGIRSLSVYWKFPFGC